MTRWRNKCLECNVISLINSSNYILQSHDFIPVIESIDYVTDIWYTRRISMHAIKASYDLVGRRRQKQWEVDKGHCTKNKPQ